MGLLRNENFQAAIVTIIVIIVNEYFPMIDTEALRLVVAAIIGALLGNSIKKGLTHLGKSS